VRSPFRSEARAFSFVLVVAVAVAAVAVAGVLAPTAVAIVVAVLAVIGVAAVYLRGGRARGIPSAPAHVGPASERRALLLVDDIPTEESLTGLRGQADRVLVVSLPGTSPVRHWISDVDGARAQARTRMEDAVSRLLALQVDATGVVADDDAFSAVDDALRTFGGDEILVATGDADLVARLRERYAIPVVDGRPT
jgi:hypothetical protein